MQFVGIGKLIDIVYENENCINFLLKPMFFYTISLVPHNRENKPKLCL